jgi:uncharacterized membrane protein YkvA (DUF1232 family)
MLDLPYMFFRGIMEIFSSPASILIFFIFLLIVVVYIYLPFDIIPDTSIFGMLDDICVFVGFIVWVVEQFMGGWRNHVNADFENIHAQ